MSEQPTRRKFLLVTANGIGGLILVGCGGDGKSPPAVCGPGEFCEIECPELQIATLGELVEGTPIDFAYPDEGLECFLVKLGEPADGGIGPEGDIVAFSYVCTHMGCSLKDGYNHAHKALGPCRCHFTTFSLRHSGMVVLGQATQNLVQVDLSLSGDAIIATGLVGVLYGELDNRCCNDPAHTDEMGAV